VRPIGELVNWWIGELSAELTMWRFNFPICHRQQFTDSPTHQLTNSPIVLIDV
jgi:hypothetical protein